ncbi:eCIS core domain-containing protein [Nocardia panacis]|nr:DUF4157 domain-containing protein [Nocardia panacis]
MPEAAPPIVHEVLHSPGHPLDQRTRMAMASRFGHDFSHVRVHTDTRAAESAEAVQALAYTVGHHVVFGADRYRPASSTGSRLLAHELTHVVQQSAAARGPVPGRLDIDRDFTGIPVHGHGDSRGPQSIRMPVLLARAPKDDADVETAPADPMAGSRVEYLVISLARGRVGFWVVGRMILGKVSTDLKPGRYRLALDLPHRQWSIREPAVRSGLRFEVGLEGADPWTLTYPAEIPLLVVPGLAKEPKTWGESVDEAGQQKDPLWLYEGWPTVTPPGPDDFESTRYDLDYRSEKGNLSKWLTVTYPYGVTKDIAIDSITEKTPRLWAAKREALKVMEEYNQLFFLGVVPTVFFLITIGAGAVGVESAGGRGRLIATRRTVPKQGSGKPPIAPRMNIHERLDVYFARLRAQPPASSADEAFAQISRTLDQVEDELSGIPKKTPPPAPNQSDGRMYPPLADSVTRAADGSIRARTRGHTIDIDANGGMTFKTRRGDPTVVFSKPGGGKP